MFTLRSTDSCRSWIRIASSFVPSAVWLLVLTVSPLSAQLILDGGGLLLVQEGPAAEVAGDLAPDNLATGAIPFASSDLGPEIGTPYHYTDNLNDGMYGNGFSWIGGDDLPFSLPFAGIDLGATPIDDVQSIAFGRSNVLSGDVCGGGICTDRHLGFYTLEYTQVPSPSSDLDIDSTGNPVTGWAEIGTLEYGVSDGVGTNYNNTWQRHRYNFDPVSATGLRLIVPGTGLGGGTAIDEIEIYNVAGEFVPPAGATAPLAITPAEGFSIAWDGNDGEFFDDIEPPDGSLVPANAALEENGGVSFSSSDLGPEIGVDFHAVHNLNDGYYGNSNSWIGGDDDPYAPLQFAGIALAEETEISAIAWGRDNGNNVTDACGGQCTDRSQGTYVLQFTRVAGPDADTPDTGDASSGWQTIGELDYRMSDDTFTTYLRHAYSVSQGEKGVVATGIRLLVPTTGLGGGTAIDEIEIYGLPFSMPCDLNDDSVCDVQDIDLLTQKVLEGTNEAAYDLNGDGLVDQADRTVWVKDLVVTWYGDANLDGEFNSGDLVAVLSSGTYEADVDSGWGTGDFNGDGRTNSSDLVTALADGGYEAGPRAAVASVPEPSSGLLLSLALGSLLALRRARRRPDRSSSRTWLPTIAPRCRTALPHTVGSAAATRRHRPTQNGPTRIGYGASVATEDIDRVQCRGCYIVFLTPSPPFFIMPRSYLLTTTCVVAMAMSTPLAVLAEPVRVPAEQPVDFAAQVQPILKQHCFDCHGPEKQESGFRLDVREAALGTADFGEPPIVPGDATSSPLWRYVAGKDEDGMVMPPEDVELRLSAAEVAVLETWINQGASWPDELAGSAKGPSTDHWAFQPLQRPAIPALQNPWIRNPIDALVLSRLQQHGLQPSPAADRSKLIRRLYLVMLGLPPTPEEVDRFARDRSPLAYEQLVDRVLSKPQFGERWARHWLDVVRFAETDGFETNRLRPNAFPYRDFVIDSLNADTPYDAFVREQLCGDALGVDVATGFLVAGPYDIVKSPDINLTLMQRQDELADMVNTTGTTFLALTLGCARCHSHKFDPITQQDYYSIQAVFAGVNHGQRPVNSARNQAARERLETLRKELAIQQSQLAELTQRARQRIAERSGSEALRPAVNSVLNEDPFAEVTAQYLRFTVHATNSGGEPCLDELEVYAPDGTNVALATAGTIATASGTLPGYDIHQLKHVNDGITGNDHSWISNTAGTGWIELAFPNPVVINRVVWGRDRLQRFTDRVAVEYAIEAAEQMGDWRVISSSADRARFDGEPSWAAILDALEGQDAQAAVKLHAEIAALKQRIGDSSTGIDQAWIGTFQQPELTHRLYRGDPLAPREVVAPDGLSVFGSLGMSTDEREQNRRVQLAEWITNPDMPLTSRVIVNRLWHYVFGTGIVDTPSDFGANGAQPTHPELLDWLSQELIDHQWSLKHVQRLILLSATFRQDSRPTEKGLAVDAASRFLWRFPPRRLEAEAIRDSMLCVSGVLDQRIGGPGFSVFEVQPENVHHYFAKTSWGPAEWRRMVYMTKVRQEHDAVFGNFDCPDGNQTIPKRSRSTTPLQALNLFNSQFVLQQSGLLAHRLRRDAGERPADQVARAFQLLSGRHPSSHEQELGCEFVGQYGLDAFCRAMLNSNEFLFVF